MMSGHGGCLRKAGHPKIMGILIQGVGFSKEAHGASSEIMNQLGLTPLKWHHGRAKELVSQGRRWEQAQQTYRTISFVLRKNDCDW